MTDVFDYATLITRKNNQRLYRERIINVQGERLEKAKKEFQEAHYRKNGREHSKVFGADLTKEEFEQQILIVAKTVKRNKDILTQINTELKTMLKTMIV